ncbi:hypothetical protein BDV34DRAFT_223113 [Aspergillus parasiticus]|uniref:Uncharacterized protein n=1 Tax=Aspergillus parasiticus TaxID=5067 RepID=A0A5N6DSZ4_ASPPA|nr:hypothetical protein BDV34DRAFT_223113 [Aspergillus parasiticus]
MASYLKNAYGYILSFRSPPPPPDINITITTSSGVLHKYGAEEDEPFTLTLEATLPEGSTNKPLTVFTSNTLLDGGGRELLRGLQVINTETGISTKLDEWMITACPRLAPHETPITNEYERKFITLMPGVPCRITNVVQRMSPLLLPSTSPLRTQAVIDRERDRFRSLSPKQWVEKLKDEMPPGSAEMVESELDWEFEDECEDKEEEILETARFDGLFAHTRYLEVGATYRVELRDTMHEITWYGYGTKEEILGSGDDGDASGRRKRPERIGDHKCLRPIALVLRNSATFTVVE